MVRLHRTLASLRIAGDDLIPEEISKLLGASPTRSRRKGDVRQSPSGSSHIWPSGQWALQAFERAPEDVDGQVAEILGQLTNDLEVWKALGQRFKIDLFCGWFMERTNEGLNISPRTMEALAARGIKLGIDIYAPPSEDEGSASS